jgi:homoserine kinase type II
MNLLALLDRYPKTCRPIGPLEPLGNAGGFSGASLWRFDSPTGPLLLRRWPGDGPDRRRIEQIHGWLNQAADLGFLPVPIATLAGPTVVSEAGRLWELAPWLEGTPDLDRPPELAHLQKMWAGLATFHVRLGADFTFGMSPGLLTRAEELDRLILKEFESLNAAIGRRSLDPASTLAKTWLNRAIPLASRFRDEVRQMGSRLLRIQPCIRDARPDHFLFQEGRLTGLVDFGAMGRDSVAGDLARLLAESIGRDRLSRSEALRAYESIRPLSEIEARSIVIFERANALLGPARWVRWHFLESRAFDETDTVVRGLRRGLERLDESDL